MNSKNDRVLCLARGPDAGIWFITLALFILLALFAGLIYGANPAQAVGTIHILDDENGGMCRDMGWDWNIDTKTCTMGSDLNIEGIDAIHIESDFVTLNGAGHTVSGSGLTHNGVTVNGMRDVTVRDLEVTGFSIGIYVRDTRGVTLTQNDLHDNSFGGYVSGSSSGNSVLNNSLTVNGYGLVIVNGPQDTEVIRNTITGNSYGIELGGSGTANNTILGNLISGSTAYGITIESGSSDNSIYNNIFNGNATHAGVFGGTGNAFNQPAPVGGNWWSGWTSPDVNSDGFVDSPYVFTGGQDDLPWVTQNGWDFAPVISNILPSGNVRTGLPTITASYADAEPTTGVNTASVSANFTSGGYPSALACTATGSPSGTISCTPADTLVSGHYDFEVHITDYRGNVGTGTGSFDVTPYHITDTTNGGDCTEIGTWDAGTKTCTLTTDLNPEKMDGIHIESDNVTLDGSGHTLSSHRTDLADTSGVKINGLSGVTVRDLTASGFMHEFYLDSASGCTLTGNTTNTIDGESGWGFFISNASNITLTGNTATGEYDDNGFELSVTTASNLNGNSVSGYGRGIDLSWGWGNTISGNVVSGNLEGITIAHPNTFTENIISGNWTGLMVTPGGIGSGPSTFYHNSFIDNIQQTENHAGIYSNYFDGGPTVGGNYWSDYDTPAEGCDDVNGDGYCDALYDTQGCGVDNYPFVTQASIDSTAPAISDVLPAGTVRDGNPEITASYSDPAFSSGIDTGSAAVVFTSYPYNAPDDYVCTATGSPDGAISCTQQGSPIYQLDQGHYEFQVSIADNNGNTGTTTGSFDIQAYRISDTAGGQDCTLFGTWDAGTKTCTMTADLNVYDLDGMYISSDGITLDGNGHSLTCTDTLGSVYWGPTIEGNSGVIIKDLTVTGFYAGVFLPGASGNTISGNHLTGNLIGAFIPHVNAPGGGIIRPSGNTIIGNDMSGNSYAGLFFINADYNRVVDNTFTGNTTMCVIADADDGAENTGLLFSGNTCSGSPDGFQLWRTHESRFVGNSVAPGTSGKGFALNQCDNNVFERNVIIGDSASGFTGFSDEGTTPDNDDNQFFSNSFIKTTFPYQFTAFHLWDAGDNGNTFTREFGGGNYYSWHDTPVEGCNDVNGDGFCDAAFNDDNRPWTTDGGWAPDYYWTWYDNVYGNNWVLMANPASAPADSWFDLEIAGDDLDPGTLEGLGSGQVPAASSLTPAYAGTMGGPVSINHRGPGQAITSQRVLWAGNSLEEVLGMDVDRISDHYYWTWYDEQSPGYKNWVMVANPDPVHDVYAEVRIAGTVRWSGVIMAGGNVTPHFPGVMGGPVEVEAWTDAAKAEPADILASQRVLMNGDTAFNELPGTPAGELSDHYVWTWYDNMSPGAQNWVMLANPRAYEIFYEVRIEGTQVATGSIGPGLTQPVSMNPGAMGGPVEVHFWKDQPGGILPATAIASQRVLWGPSFGELPGYPYTALDSTYHWTWYDQKSPGAANWVMVALDPAETGQVHVVIEYTAYRDDGSTELRTGETDLDAAVAGQTRWYWADPGYRGGPVEVTAHLRDHPETPRDVIASQRVLWNGFFNEVVGTVIN